MLVRIFEYVVQVSGANNKAKVSTSLLSWSLWLPNPNVSLQKSENFTVLSLVVIKIVILKYDFVFLPFHVSDLIIYNII